MTGTKARTDALRDRTLRLTHEVLPNSLRFLSKFPHEKKPWVDLQECSVSYRNDPASHWIWKAQNYVGTWQSL
jgi:hypothetical protein